MEKRTEKTEAILRERFGQDCLISLATAEDGVPYVRHVNAFYEDGSFYVLTHALSNKIRQIERNAVVSICGEWFTAQGTAVILGAFSKEENRRIAERMKILFAGWLDNGHMDLADEHTCILEIRLKSGVLLSHGTRYDIDFE